MRLQSCIHHAATACDAWCNMLRDSAVQPRHARVVFIVMYCHHYQSYVRSPERRKPPKHCRRCAARRRTAGCSATWRAAAAGRKYQRWRAASASRTAGRRAAPLGHG